MISHLQTQVRTSTDDNSEVLDIFMLTTARDFVSPNGAFIYKLSFESGTPVGDLALAEVGYQPPANDVVRRFLTMRHIDGITNII